MWRWLELLQPSWDHEERQPKTEAHTEQGWAGERQGGGAGALGIRAKVQAWTCSLYYVCAGDTSLPLNPADVGGSATWSI